VSVLGEALTPIAMLHQQICISQGHRPVEAMAEGFDHQGFGGRVVSAFPLMYLFQQL
jgi:hypothetical protein